MHDASAIPILQAGPSLPSSPSSRSAIGLPTPTMAWIGRGEVRHTRLRPARHAFAYPTWFLLLPLRAQAGAPSLGPVARNRPGLVSFWDADHGEGGADALAWLDGVLATAGITDARGDVWLHTYPRVLGIVFKPVSFWYVHALDGQLAAVVVEVNNTFGERHVYALPGAQWGRESEADKVFHVSPFCTVQGTYRFRFLATSPSHAAVPRTVVRIDHDDAEGPLIQTSVSGALQPLTAASVRAAFWGVPWLSLGVLARIHWQAARLWLKRVPVHRKPALPAQAVSRGHSAAASPRA